jgi:putative ABC transport system permease protein
MKSLRSDVRFAVRSLVKARGFSIAVIAILALAIALETSVVAVVNAYLVRALPYPESDRLYNVSYARPEDPTVQGLAKLDWRSLDDIIEHPIAWDLDVFYLIGGDHAEAARGGWVTQDFMQGFGIQPLIGRAFVAEEFAPGSPQVVLISHRLWQSRFGGDSTVLGRAFDAYVSDRPNDPERFTIVGVLAANFWHLNPYTDVLTPLRGAETYPYIVKLRAGVPPALAAQRITQLALGGGVVLPPNRPVELESMHARLASRVKPILTAIAASVSLVLLIACANVAFLVLIRGIRRQKEVAMRLALGASQRHIARMLVTEAMLLVGVAAVVGTGLAWLVTRQLAGPVAQQLGRPAPGGDAAVSIDWGVGAVIVAVAVVIALALTFAPMLVSWRQSLYGILRRGKQGGHEGSRGRRTRFALITLEVAGSLALLSGCGLMIRTVSRMLDTDLGMQPAGVMTSTLAIRDRTYPDAQSRAAFYERLLGTLESTPGVTAAALSYPSPLAELPPRPVRPDAGPEMRTGIFSVTPRWFDALSIPLVQGRLFSVADRSGSERVALVSESAARRLWPNGSALGHTLHLEAWEDTVAVSRTVVGIVRDVRHSPTDDEPADVYIPYLQDPIRFSRIVMRASGSSVSLLDQLRRITKEIDPEATVAVVQPLSVDLSAQMSRPRFLATTFAAFGVFATVLTLLGVYGVIAYAVKQREHEVAVRMAVGADPTSIVRLFVSDGAVILAAGIVLGLLGAFAIGRLLQAQLFGVEQLDPAALTVAVLTLSIACFAAIWWPARRATRTDPVVTLREE